MPTKEDLMQRQALPLRAKVLMSQIRIREWFHHFSGDVYISFSGGKDSTVLAHLVREVFPDVPIVFADTGLEYPEIRKFAKEKGAEFVKPKMGFAEVISKYGYPIISKEISGQIACARAIRGNNPRFTGYHRADFLGERIWNGKSAYNKEKWLTLCQESQFMVSDRCCYVMKKTPLHTYERKTGRFPYVGTLTEESQLRKQAWLKHGCNSFDGKKKTSQPMSFWREQDVLQYIKENSIEIASVYGDIVNVGDDGFQYEETLLGESRLKCTGCQRTGCIFCGYGAHLEKGETRFQRLSRTHPKQYEYCIGGGQWVDNPKYDPSVPEYDGKWKNWNPKKIWVPSKHGLGMGKVFDDLNQMYGKDFIRYD